MRRASSATVVTGMFLLLVVSGCGKLTRPEAARIYSGQITEHDQTITVSFEPMSRVDPAWTYANLDKQKQAALVGGGYVREFRGLFGAPCIAPTDKMMPYLTQPARAGQTIHVNLAVFDGVDVTGIAESSKNNCSVEGVVRYKPNELGSLVLDPRDLARHFEVGFKKYDDGWRVD